MFISFFTRCFGILDYEIERSHITMQDFEMVQLFEAPLARFPLQYAHLIKARIAYAVNIFDHNHSVDFDFSSEDKFRKKLERLNISYLR